MRLAPLGERAARAAGTVQVRPARVRVAALIKRVAQLVRDDGGAVTAEFAVVLPAVVVVLGVAIGSISLAAHRITLVSLAGELARFEARGDDAEAQAVLARIGPDTEITRSNAELVGCVTLTSHPAGGILAAIGVSARACAATTDAVG